MSSSRVIQRHITSGKAETGILANLGLFWPEVAHITKTHLYNYDPLKPHFYIEKTGVYRGIHYFSYFCSKHKLWVLVRTASRGGSNEYLQFMFWAEMWKLLEFFIWKLSFFLVVNFSVYLNRHVLVMDCFFKKRDQVVVNSFHPKFKNLIFHQLTCLLLLLLLRSVKNQNRIANSVDPDEMAHDKPSHQDLHCLHSYLVWPAGLKELKYSRLHTT